MEAALLTEILKYGIGGALAVFFYLRWQKAEDRYDKLRDAFDLRVQQHHEKTLELQKQGFEHSLRVEGIIANSNQALESNVSVMHGLMKVLAQKGITAE